MKRKKTDDPNNENLQDNQNIQTEKKSKSEESAAEVAWFDRLHDGILTNIFSNFDGKNLANIRLVNKKFKQIADKIHYFQVRDKALRLEAKELIKKLSPMLGHGWVDGREGKIFRKDLNQAIGALENIINKTNDDYQILFDLYTNRVENLDDAEDIDEEIRVRREEDIVFQAISEKEREDFSIVATNASQLAQLYFKKEKNDDARFYVQKALSYRFEYVLDIQTVKRHEGFLDIDDVNISSGFPEESQEEKIYSMMTDCLNDNSTTENLEKFLQLKLNNISSTLQLHIYDFLTYVFSIDQNILASEEAGFLDGFALLQSFQTAETLRAELKNMLQELEKLIDPKPLQTRSSWQRNQSFLPQDVEEKAAEMQM